MFQMGEPLQTKEFNIPRTSFEVDMGGPGRGREDAQWRGGEWDKTERGNNPKDYSDNSDKVEEDGIDNDIRPIMGNDFSYTYSPIVHGPKWYPTMASIFENQLIMIAI